MIGCPGGRYRKRLWLLLHQVHQVSRRHGPASIERGGCGLPACFVHPHDHAVGILRLLHCVDYHVDGVHFQPGKRTRQGLVASWYLQLTDPERSVQLQAMAVHQPAYVVARMNEKRIRELVCRPVCLGVGVAWCAQQVQVERIPQGLVAILAVVEIPLVLLGLRRHDTPQRFPSGVIVAENVSHGDVMRAWKNCDVAVVPSRWPDPWPLVALEAMAAGRPVVASAVGGLRTLVQDGKTGIQVPPGDVAALRAGIQRLLSDPLEQSRMGDAGRERAVGYKASELVPKIEQVYREVINA